MDAMTSIADNLTPGNLAGAVAAVEDFIANKFVEFTRKLDLQTEKTYLQEFKTLPAEILTAVAHSRASSETGSDYDSDDDHLGDISRLDQSEYDQLLDDARKVGARAKSMLIEERVGIHNTRSRPQRIEGMGGIAAVAAKESFSTPSKSTPVRIARRLLATVRNVLSPARAGGAGAPSQSDGGAAAGADAEPIDNEHTSGDDVDIVGGCFGSNASETVVLHTTGLEALRTAPHVTPLRKFDRSACRFVRSSCDTVDHKTQIVFESPNLVDTLAGLLEVVTDKVLINAFRRKRDLSETNLQTLFLALASILAAAMGDGFSFRPATAKPKIVIRVEDKLYAGFMDGMGVLTWAEGVDIGAVVLEMKKTKLQRSQVNQMFGEILGLSGIHTPRQPIDLSQIAQGKVRHCLGLLTNGSAGVAAKWLGPDMNEKQNFYMRSPHVDASEPGGVFLLLARMMAMGAHYRDRALEKAKLAIPKRFYAYKSIRIDEREDADEAHLSGGTRGNDGGGGGYLGDGDGGGIGGGGGFHGGHGDSGGVGARGGVGGGAGGDIGGGHGHGHGSREDGPTDGGADIEEGSGCDAALGGSGYTPAKNKPGGTLVRPSAPRGKDIEEGKIFATITRPVGRSLPLPSPTRFDDAVSHWYAQVVSPEEGDPSFGGEM